MSKFVDRGRTFEDEAEDAAARSAVAWMLATASLGTTCLSLNCISVWVLLSTVFGFGHSAAVDEAAAVVVAAASAVDEVVARWPNAIFCMAALKRPAGKYQ